MRASVVAFALMLLVAGPVSGADLDHVRLLQETYETPVLPAPGYAEAQFRYQDWDGATGILLGGQGAYLVMPSPVGGLDVGVATGFLSLDPEEGDGESGLMDVDVVGRYRFMDMPAKFAAGAVLSLPVGKKELPGQGGFDIELFGATRYDLEALSLEGHFGLRINGGIDREVTYYDPWTGQTTTQEVEIDGELSIKIGGGVLFAATPQLTVLGELSIETARFDGGDSDIRLTPGVDFRLNPDFGLRGGLGLGLGDGSPDFELVAGAAINWGG